MAELGCREFKAHDLTWLLAVELAALLCMYASPIIVIVSKWICFSEGRHDRGLRRSQGISMDTHVG